MNAMQATFSSHQNKNGIALIVVLGFLSLLIMLAIALMITMRTERMVSDYALEDVRTRYLLHTALASAMIDYSSDLWAEGLVAPTTNYAIYESLGSGTNLGFQLLSGEVTNWLPRRYLYSSVPSFNGPAIAPNTEWVLIHDKIAPQKVLGRYAYMCFDCTGQLDINLVSQFTGTDPMKRGEGFSIGEIDASLLPETVGNKTDFFQGLQGARTIYKRFDTLSEIWNLNSTNGLVFSAAKLSQFNNFAPYSLCYDRGWWDWDAGEQRAAGELSTGATVPADIRNWTETHASQVFQDVGYNQANTMAQCLMDYMNKNASGEWVPTATDIPTCKPIPMINEFRIVHGLTYNAGAWEVRYVCDLIVELWFPWAFTNIQNYQLTVQPPVFNNGQPIRARLGGGPIVDFTPIPGGGAPIPISRTWNYNDFVVVTSRYEFSYQFPLEPVETDFPVDCRPGRAENFGFLLRDTTDGADVDAVTLGDIRIVLNALRMEWPPNTQEFQPQGARAVNDPRINHVSDAWDITLAPTLGSINSVENFNRASDGVLEGLPLYARNSSNLSSVAELGYIPTGVDPAVANSAKRWNTVDLFSTRGAKCLSRFRCGPFGINPEQVGWYSDTVEYPRPLTWTNTAGLIHPNSTYTNVIIAAFQGTPIPDYPGGPTNTSVSADAAKYIATGWLLNGPSSNATDWVLTPAFSANGYLSNPIFGINLNNNQKETIIRNSFRLFNPNQNLFTIVVVAQGINDQGTIGDFDDEDIITSEKRAVALVWRDPFPNEDGRHEMFIRRLKYLDE